MSPLGGPHADSHDALDAAAPAAQVHDAPAAAAASSAPAVSGRTLPAWLREPLLHFLLLGAALFALDHAVTGRRDDPHTIVMGQAVDDEARATFQAARGRAPDAKELQALRDRWLDNEVLYREGLAMQMDRGDTAIRERVIFKALSVVDANVKAPPIDEKGLRAWFEQHRAQYDEPARLDFDEAVLTGDTSESAVRSFVDRLEHGTGGDLEAGLRVFKGRPEATITQAYGESFAKALAAAPVGHWIAIASKDGWRAIHPNAVTPGRAAAFEPLRGVVLQDWTDATLADQRTAAVRALAKKYTVKVEGAAK